MKDKANPAAWSRWQWRALLTLTIVLALFVAAASLSHLARATGQLRDWILQPPATLALTQRAPVGWLEVIDVEAGSEAARVGFRRGDFVRTQVFGVWPGSVLAPGTSLPLTVNRQGKLFEVTWVAPQPKVLPPDAGLAFGSQAVAGLVSVLLGILLVLKRGRRDRAAALLGILLLCLGWAVGGAGMIWAPATFFVQLRWILGTLATAGLAWLLPISAMELAAPQAGPRERRAIMVSATLLSIATIASSLADVVPLLLPALLGNATWLLAAAALFFAIVARHYPHIDAPSRNRVKIVLLACLAYIASFGLFITFNVAGQSADLLWTIIASSLIGLGGPTLIAYALLRGKLFDFNFALNRTLVYATVSFVLLAAFGGAKWVIEHLIPESWHAGSEYYSFAIALGLFLVLHRVHTWVERNVERVFFGAWHRNEATLRRFVAAAGHFEQSGELCRAFAEELRRFAGGAGAALYRRDRSGAYALQHGNLPDLQAQYPPDDLALALMRAERGPVRLSETRTALPGALALPMLDHGALSGFALVERKPDSAEYRPDEVEALGWAAQQVGLDLQTMHVGELEAEVTRLNERLAAGKGRPSRKRATAA